MSLSEALLNNPFSIQQNILNELESRIDGGGTVVDANNPFMFLMESFSRIVADSTDAMDTKLSELYPIRARTTKDLYNHFSDYDYVGFYSYPAPLKMTMMLHRDYLVKNAIQLPDSNYKLVVIPADTIFTVGRFKLGLYYPIHIKINTIIDTISASYDTTTENPLKSLSTNNLEVRANTYEGVNMVSIEFDTYQFDKTVYSESINPDLGFIKRYQYTDKFYAIRIFDTIAGTEFNYTMSDSVYDLDKPTAILRIYPESNEVEIAFPQIYFTNGLINNQIQVEILTTLGAIDASLANVQLSDVKANFAMSSPNTDLTYTNIFKNIPTIVLVPSDTRIVGGSNSYTFEQMKEYTIYHNDSISVPITRLNLERFFASNGFSYMPKIDNLTDRRYYAYRKIYLNDDNLGTVCGGLTVTYDEENTRQDVLYQNNDTIVILPTAIYKYITSVKKFEIIDDVAKTLLLNAASTQLVGLINGSNYFCNPHHIVITTLDRYPACDLYDLLTTTTENLSFLDENIYLSAQLSIVSVAIRHLNNGSGGYVIRIVVQRSEDLTNTSIDDINCTLTAMTKDGYRVGIRGVSAGTYNGLDLFDFTVSTNYKILNSRITTTNLKVNGSYPKEYELDLSGTMHIATFVKKTAFPTVAQDSTIINYLIDDDNSWLGVSLQSFDYSLGTNLSDVLDPNLLTNWTNLVYSTYPLDVLMTYEHDVYETNADGSLKYTINSTTNTIEVNKLHSVGDVVYDNGVPVIKHRAGEVIIDAGGNPVEVKSRMKDFTIEITAFEYSHRVVIDTFLETLSAELSSYYDTIRNMDNDVLENTDIYFRPIITTNDGHYKVNNSTIIASSLELSFVFNCYVTQATLDDTTLIGTLYDKAVTIISDHLDDPILSLTNIATSIRTELSEYINSIDAVSLNGDTTIQTLMNIDVDKAPKLGMSLTIGTDGHYQYSPNVKINFKPLDT